MPVRKIPKNYVSVTGVFSSDKNGRSLGYESLLERDLMILLEYDDSVEKFEEQPVKIPFAVGGKNRKPYVPDILIHYYAIGSGKTPKPVLGEVKDSQDLKRNKKKYAPKFEAAAKFAEERGWEWRKFTEKEIRTPYLDNLKFLREYHRAQPDPSLIQKVIDELRRHKNAVSIESLQNKLCASDDDVLEFAPALWHLLATKEIVASLKNPLTMKTKLSLASGGPCG